ncbi:NOB1 zinc finger-like protein [Glarea lozoyensis ATCC 20868]|uniref:20S-pre-rRNA D-site endonuclease NOB1 n=2 Tax=Glarea lozoyensis TaxID=101852 RepID=S3D952_GLAL2|nr:NOB1 zinc finger-like protein [Glarea lozoyensis ATCC 20868]EHK96128.1 putative 20S-pre-rRNA D-site endonuclease nob1 [Glarea lozoyensis 74030]EPE34240.1 NOB1 zinc finger-like protein [Glarea lozoyensis ATCC 20868]
MSNDTPKPVHSLVLDAGPIIKNEPSVSTLLGQAEFLYTIPAVIDEIRDETTRMRIEMTLRPFLISRQPNPASIKVITDFARRTGDLEVLSRPDVHLMALAYELECERNHGDWRLRSVPGQKGLNGKPPGSALNATVEKVVAAEGTKSEEAAEAKQEDVPRDTTSTNQSIETQLGNTHITPDFGKEANEKESQPEPGPADEEAPQPANAIVEEQPNEAEDSDEEGWITPQNLKEHQAKDAEGSVEPAEEIKIMQVATITSDFAMQNVLMRMNLNLLSSSLKRIQQVKTWVLRCHGCFAITRDMTKQFCARCGKDTLLRTSCSTDKNGNFQVHLKKNMQWNTRGNVYSIPKPVAGTSNGKLVSGGGKGGWGQSLILAEDQKEYVQALTNGRRQKERDLMDEDYLPSILSGDRKGPGGRPRVGAGKGVNSKRRH